MSNASEIPRDLLRQEVKEVVEFMDGGPDMPHAELRLILAKIVEVDKFPTLLIRDGAEFL